MFALAALGFALVVLVRSSANTVFNAEQAHMLGVATDLARGKMYDIEEKEIKEGFTDTDQSQLDWKGFEDEGWPQIQYRYKVEHIEMPSWDDLAAMAQGKMKLAGSAAGSGVGSAFGSGFGSGLGSAFDPLQSFQNSALGGMLAMFGGAGANGKSMDVLGAQGGALIQSQYQLFQQILKVSVIKLTLDVQWKVLGSDRDLKVVEFLTDPVQMDRVLGGLGASPLGNTGSGAGSSAGSGAGSSTKPTTTTTTPGRPVP
jgi:hypothetical protein